MNLRPSFLLLTALALGMSPALGAATSAEWVRITYLALTQESIVPADPRVVATAALETSARLAPERALPLPAGFGHDAEKDAAWLAERVPDAPALWEVLEAMARAPQTAHVWLTLPPQRQRLQAFFSGRPFSVPGFNLIPQADGRFLVFDILKGASADVCGLRTGDVLLRIDGRLPVRADSFRLIVLPPGTEVTLAIERDHVPLTLQLRLSAAAASPVESRLLPDGIACVFVRWFAHSDDPDRDTAALVRRAVGEYAAQGARGLILDLRSALGGSGEVSIASALCDSPVIYSVKKPLDAPARAVPREGPRLWPDRPIVVLVNQHTVSAGEALALALRELTPAKIVGQKTGGGLTEMSFIPLADGVVLSIPTGADFGPVTGTVPADYAVAPDLVVPNPSLEELQQGIDHQLDAARRIILGGDAR